MACVNIFNVTMNFKSYSGHIGNFLDVLVSLALLVKWGFAGTARTMTQPAPPLVVFLRATCMDNVTSRLSERALSQPKPCTAVVCIQILDARAFVYWSLPLVLTDHISC